MELGENSASATVESRINQAILKNGSNNEALRDARSGSREGEAKERFQKCR
jgi:hypothetical protein